MMSNKYYSCILKIIFSCIFLLKIFNSHAHEIRPAYLEITQNSNNSYQVYWKVPLLDNKSPKINPSLPKYFSLEQISELFLPDAIIRRYVGNYNGKLNGQTIAIEGLDMTLVDVLVQISLIDKTSYTFLLQPDRPMARVPVEPNKLEVIKLYLLLGVEHILLGIDHLLFVFGLLLLVKGTGTLIKTITAFTLAHSITLGLATLGFFNIPQAPVEACIALSILFLAKEYICQKEGKNSLTASHPWLVALIFGLLHGFGFAGALIETGLPQKDIPLALFTFNIGVELGQLLFIGAVIFTVKFIRKANFKAPEWSWKILPYTLGSISSYWLIERVISFCT